MKASVPFEDVAVNLYREDPTLAADVLNACLADGETEEFLLALRYISKAFGSIREVAQATGLHEKTLYKTLSTKGNPSLKTLMNLASAMDMQIAFIPKKQTAEV